MADFEKTEDEEDTQTPVVLIILVSLIILLLLAGGTSIILYTDNFMAKMLGAPFCLISAIGLSFWLNSSLKG